ncbi:MAG: transglycosylase SLT domain-containing protein [Bryobacterales bacterium]|nr:transglycosylase SLT domain-containing protein [Bryobacterales bacterium]
MPGTNAGPGTKTWLVSRSGPLAGTRYLISEGVTRIGRSRDNDIVIQGPQAAVVSQNHLEIAREGAACRVRDLGSTNGTYLDGEPVASAELHPHAVLQLGRDGPEFVLLREEEAPAELDRTLVAPKGAVPSAPVSASAAPAREHDDLLTDAVQRARQARAEGAGGQTMLLMRDALNSALRISRRRSRLVIYALAAALVLTTSYGFVRISRLKREKTSIDQLIRGIEKRLEAGQAGPEETDRLIAQLAAYQEQAEGLRRNLLFRLGVREPEAFVTQEIRTLMVEFGAEAYSVPPEFTERVNYYIQQYQGPDRALIARALGQAKGQLETMRRVLEEERLPPDFAYLPLVESAFAANQTSAAGAAGPWQFTPATAKAHGLRVDGAVDERHDLAKSTRAACRYLRSLILDFGAGSSVMLALAAYNLGPTRVKQAVAKTVQDPIKQRNFWYLYRARALPPETREYVPKIFAAIIIGRNPQRLGF